MAEVRIDITRARISLLNNIRTIIKQARLLKQGINVDTAQHRGQTLKFEIDEKSLTRDKEALREQLKQYTNSFLVEFKKQSPSGDEIYTGFDKNFYTVDQAIDIVMSYIDDAINSEAELKKTKEGYRESDLPILLNKAAINDYMKSLIPPNPPPAPIPILVVTKDVTIEIPPLE